MILALQYYNGDRAQAFKLAQLLADLEPRYRDDVVLALVCQPDTTIDEVTEEVLLHCRERFPTTHVVSKYGAQGWADGSGQLWRGVMTHFSKLRREHLIPDASIFTFDGGDGVPLHCNWIDLMVEQHEITRSRGKMVSGTLCLDVPAHPNINGNMILDFELWEKYPSLHDTPLGASTAEWWKTWDTYHAPVFIANASPSSIVCNHWNRRGVNEAILRATSAESIWLHGYKDTNFCDVVRSYLLGYQEGKATRPLIRRTIYDLGAPVLS